LLCLTAVLPAIGLGANLAVSTYLRDGFTPAAIASDPQGNIYLAGTAITDPASQMMGAVVAKVDPKVTGYLYLSYFDSPASDQIAAIAVDSAGNAYIAGTTTNPNFPLVGGGALGTAPVPGGPDMRPFVAKLNPQGAVVFSVLVGGSTSSTARGIAITPQGQILVSGLALTKGFPSTPGAYSVADTTNQWFLMELDASATKTIFSATGIGGSSILVDASGAIYMAGSSVGTSYPTTAGAYQTTFVQGSYCFGLCQIGFQGNLQHVTKTDAGATKLIYSTGLNDPKGGAGSTTNTGLAVDAAGNAYVTGTLFEGIYPFTVTATQGATSFLTKLDAAGANAIYSLPIGGAGVQLDASGALYVGGVITSVQSVGFGVLGPPVIVAIPPAFANIPQTCLPNFTTAISEAYVMKVSAANGDVQDAQWLDGAAVGAAGIALAGGKVWIAGPTGGPHVPMTPSGLSSTGLGPGFVAGAYVSAVDFSAPASGPSIGCVLDAGNGSHIGVVAGFQLLSIFGSNLGPANGIAAPDGVDPSLGGVSITFDGTPAGLLYASASQINVAVPAQTVPPTSQPKAATVMRLTYNGASVERRFPLVLSNLNLFADLFNRTPCPSMPVSGFQVVALNADGSSNSCSNPAKAGSTISLFLHGVGGFNAPADQLTGLHANIGFGCTAPVVKAALNGTFVYKVDVLLPMQFGPCSVNLNNQATAVSITLSHNDDPVGPFNIPANAAGPVLNFLPPGTPTTLIVWVSP
jgi:uncharacterized protein (TIGR03437 family)